MTRREIGPGPNGYYIRLYDPLAFGWPWAYAVCWRDGAGIEHVESISQSIVKERALARAYAYCASLTQAG